MSYEWLTRILRDSAKERVRKRERARGREPLKSRVSIVLGDFNGPKHGNIYNGLFWSALRQADMGWAGLSCPGLVAACGLWCSKRGAVYILA